MKAALRTTLTLAGAALSFALLTSGPTFAQTAETVQGPVATTIKPAKASAAPVGAVAAKMPLADALQFRTGEQQAGRSTLEGVAGASPDMFGRQGGGGRGALSPTLAVGTSTAPYTTARVAVEVLGDSSSVANTPVTSFPYRATGKLYFKIASNWYVCTASLVKKGVLITAAHCAQEFGQGANGWHTNFSWCPANTTGSGGVYGCYAAGSPRVPTPYFNGTDTCTQSGVVCNNDIATLLVEPIGGVYAGSRLGWYAYGWNGYSYKASSVLGNVTAVQLTQLGYPVAFDSGYQMQRTDAVGWYYSSGYLKNTQIGTAQTGGSSGGPWIANFGTVPTVDTSKASLGSSATLSVVGVTSYGSATLGYNRQGASYFGQNKEFPNSSYGSYGAGNIGKLMYDTCTGSAAYC